MPDNNRIAMEEAARAIAEFPIEQRAGLVSYLFERLEDELHGTPHPDSKAKNAALLTLAHQTIALLNHRLEYHPW